MRLLTLTAAAALLAAAPVSANELLRVYDLAAQNDTQLRAAQAARDAGRYATRQTFGALLPQVNGRGELSAQEFTTKVPGGEVTTTSEPFSAAVSVRQTLFNAATWNRWQQAGDRVDAAEAMYAAAEQTLALRVGEAYFNVLGAADNVRFADAARKAIERQLELAKRRFEVGLSAITDVQEAQARYDLTVAELIEAEQAFASARDALAEITGTGDSKIQPLREEIPLEGPNPDSIAAWIKAAAESNLEIVLARSQAEIARQEIDVNRAGHYPDLSIVGQQGIGEQAGLVGGEYESNSIGLELNVPIFAGGTTRANVGAAKSIHEQRLAELEGKQREIERRTRNAYQGVIAGVARVKAYKQAVVSNTTALEASEVGLEVGARTAVDVLNAQRELYAAQRNYARARYDYLLNVLRLKNAAGQLGVSDLREIDQLLETDTAVAGG